ncbi:class I SAM-dependent methyltransferase [Nocardioides daeguensis]|uniref:Class I SAM-dependent methyltransferase n=2 Tax=Nocardioides daeguensis TaxID=908359 RepID=A0ABP6WAL3_9ACTN
MDKRPAAENDRGVAMFEVADAYISFMGRFSTPLAPLFADVGLAGVPPAATVLDVGCGPGMLTAELVRRHGAAQVAAVDPVATFVAAAAAAHPGADVRRATAEALPFTDESFDATLAQLVVHFMSDPLGGLSEMRRVTRPGGRVSACVWDHGGGTGALSAFWRAILAVDPTVTDEATLPGSNAGDLTRLLADAGLREVTEVPLTVSVPFATFEEWWAPYTLGVGTAGVAFAALPGDQQDRVVELLRDELGDGPFAVTATAWAGSGVR